MTIKTLALFPILCPVPNFKKFRFSIADVPKIFIPLIITTALFIRLLLDESDKAVVYESANLCLKRNFTWSVFYEF